MTGVVLVSVFALQTDVQVTLREAKRLEEAGNPTGALESYRRALEQSRPGAPERGLSLLGLASLEIDLGHYDEAAGHARDATAVFEPLGDRSNLGLAYNRAGLAATYAGKYVEAEQAIRSALDISTKLNDQNGRAEELGNLGNVHFYVGRYGEAARMYDESLAVTTASKGEPWAARRRRLTLANQASLFQRLGRGQEALALYKELGASSAGLPPSEYAQVLANLGVLYRRLGDPIKALETYDEAKTLFARDRHVDGELNVLKNRGIVLALDLGKLEEAERSFTEALETATRIGNRREMLHAHLYRGETRFGAGHRVQAGEDFAAGMALARELKTPEEEWKALYGLGRVEARPEAAVEYLRQAVATIEQVRESIRVPSLRSDFLSDKRVVYDALITARLPQGSAAELFGLLERSHSREWRERLGLETRVDLDAVQRTLGPGVLLLDYWNSPNGSAVIAVTRSRAALIPLGIDSAAIAALVDGLAAGPSPRWREHAAAMPLLPPRDWFDGIEHVIVIPDGAVALVPFELLTTGDRLLIEQSAVSYTPTAAMLLRPASSQNGLRPPWRLQLKVFAAPVFASARLDDPRSVRDGVKATAEEARRISSELAGRSALHVGQANQKAFLLATTDRAPILHLATHAAADVNAMEQSRIMFSSPPGQDSSADYLFLKEAYDLPLDGVELAVLSACETARGRLVRGEGVQSFSRAFLAAGARSTVTTLWRVADQPTVDFMTVFYHHLQRGETRDEALRRAKLRFLASGSPVSDPHFWAAFVLTGDGVHPIPRAVPWSVVTAAGLALAALPLAVAGIRRRQAGRSIPPLDPS